MRHLAPTRGTSRSVWARVCSIDMNSLKSSRLNAQLSWVLITVICCPRATCAALPRRAGISFAGAVILSSSHVRHACCEEPCNGIDLHHATQRDASHRPSCAQPSGCSVTVLRQVGRAVFCHGAAAVAPPRRVMNSRRFDALGCLPQASPIDDRVGGLDRR